MMAKLTYNGAWRAIGPSIRRDMLAVAAECRKMGVAVSPVTKYPCGDENGWSFMAAATKKRLAQGCDGPDDRLLDVNFKLVDAVDYSGDPDGYNLMWECTSVGGRIVGEWAPYNYTERVWTFDVKELHDRMRNFDPATAARTIVRELKR